MCGQYTGWESGWIALTGLIGLTGMIGRNSAPVYLWCIVHGEKCNSLAPTGIAAANVEIEGGHLKHKQKQCIMNYYS